MKKIFIAIILAQALFFNMLNSAPIDYKGLPLFTGDINDPDLIVLVIEDDFWIVELDGEEFFYPL